MNGKQQRKYCNIQIRKDFQHLFFTEIHKDDVIRYLVYETKVRLSFQLEIFSYQCPLFISNLVGEFMRKKSSIEPLRINPRKNTTQGRQKEPSRIDIYDGRKSSFSSPPLTHLNTPQIFSTSGMTFAPQLASTKICILFGNIYTLTPHSNITKEIRSNHFSQIKTILTRKE